MSRTGSKLGKHRFLLILLGLVIVAGASLPPFMTASCLTRLQTSAEQKALDNLRNMTRGGALPPEDVVARIESDFPRTKTAALARILRARIKLNAKDYQGAASLLDAKVISEQTSLEDYALFLHGSALEQAGRDAEARSYYQQLIHDYPSSLRTREATLRAAELLVKSGSAAAVPLLLKNLDEKDDGAALLATAKAYEQSSDQIHALAAYRRIYFFAPDSPESAVALAALPRLGSNSSPTSAAEATARAERLFGARKFTDALAAYGDAFVKFPATATPQNQLHKGIAAYNVRKFPEAIDSLNAVPLSAGEVRAEALYYLAQSYARARQWEGARSTAEELRRTFPASNFTPRTFVAIGQLAADAKNLTDSSYFLRSAVNSFSGSVEVAQAQFDLAWAAHEAKNYSE